MNLIKDENVFKPVPSTHDARILSLVQCLERNLLSSPDEQQLLYLENDTTLTCGDRRYPIHSGNPVLYPARVMDEWQNGNLKLDYYCDSLLQYVLLSQIKQQGDAAIRAPQGSKPVEKHQYRLKNFCRGFSGLVLDVGCDSPMHSIQLLPSECEYVGIDPYLGEGGFRIVGLGQVLPFTGSVFDHILFNTSLDHMLCYHTAIEEAARVLKPGGLVTIATYAWINNATLLTDHVHFHHFREYEIVGSLRPKFDILDLIRFECPKHDKHRYGLYVSASKRC